MKKSISYYMFHAINYLLLSIVALVTFAPFLMVLSTSFTSEKYIAKHGYTFIIRDFSLDAYKFALSGGSRLIRSYDVTIFMTVVGTGLSLIVTGMLAYGLSRKDLPGKNWLTFFLIIPMLFSGGLIPWFIVVKNFGLLNSIWSMIIPSLVNAWYVFIMRNFFYTIPDSLEESAKIDGAGYMYIFWKIILPLSTPAMATIGLFYAIEYWNQWYNALMFIQDINKFPLQMLLRQIIDSTSSTIMENFTNNVSINTPGESLKMATVILTMGPIILIYPFVQKYFVKGIMIGALKG